MIAHRFNGFNLGFEDYKNIGFSFIKINYKSVSNP